jgi:hypothetical protein
MYQIEQSWGEPWLGRVWLKQIECYTFSVLR